MYLTNLHTKDKMMKMRYFHSIETLPGCFIMFLVLILGTFQQGFSQGNQTFNYTGSTQTFTAPAGVTSITVAAWGGGGRGGSSTGGNTSETGGGGGGAYSLKVTTVVPGTTYNVFVGAGSTSTSAGGDSYFINTSTILAKGGNSGANNTTTGATGGALASGVGDFRYSGGNGANGSDGNYGGGGGSSAGTGTNGNSATNQTGATAPTGGGNGGNGPTSAGNGSAGSAPGGGGGGVRSAGANPIGGAGGSGKVVITWTCPSATISYAASSFCKSVTIPQSITFSGSGGGTFSAAPAGLTIDAAGTIIPSTSTSGTYTVHYIIAADRGCSLDATTSVTINPVPTASATKNDISCFDAHDGQIVVTGSNGTAPYTYSIYNGVAHSPYTDYQSVNAFTGLAPGQYKIRVKDANGCESVSIP